jgi:hypothetical protein
MVKKQKPEVKKADSNSCGVALKNGKYYCVDCGCEVPEEYDCPECQRQVDWTRAIIEIHRSAV